MIVPILRAGLGMVNGIQDLIPTAKIAHVGMYRDEETLEPHTYFEKYPKNFRRSNYNCSGSNVGNRWIECCGY